MVSVLSDEKSETDNRESGVNPERSGHCKQRVFPHCHCACCMHEKGGNALLCKPGDLLKPARLLPSKA